VSTDTLNHNGNHHCAHPSNIQSVGLLLMQRCRSEADQLALLKKQKDFSPRSGELLSQISSGDEPKGNGDAYSGGHT
jgi:hypothetical protein